jgi:glycosyltransferase involved in cell wall biosynthesis
MLAPEALAAISASAEPFALDFHDDPILQNEALGVMVDRDWVDRETDRKRRNLDAFPWHVVPSRELADLAGLDPSRVVIAGNGTDTSIVQPMPWPTEPVVAMMSGAAPSRGIEDVIAAVENVREQIPELRLVLWLAATGVASERYLADLREATAREHWVGFASAPYAEIGQSLGRAMVQCVPNPAGLYWDSVVPIKVFDAMASGRPLVVTPRRSMAALVTEHKAGLVAAGDGPEDLAASILRLLEDDGLARRLGANGRAAAVDFYDWSNISTNLARTLLTLAG